MPCPSKIINAFGSKFWLLCFYISHSLCSCLIDAMHLVIRFCQVGVWNQQNLYPRIPTTDVAKLLQYSGFRVEHGDGFSS